MKKKGLFSKMLATYTLIIVISFVILAAFLSLWFEKYYFDQRKSQLQSGADLIQPTAIDYMNGNIDSNKMGETLNFFGYYLNTDIWLTDSYGIAYAVSDEKYKDLIGKQVLTEDLEKLRTLQDVERKDVYKNIFKASMHTLEIPITYRGMFKGSIIMNTKLNEIKGPLNKVYNIIWLSAVLAIIVSCVVIYYFSQRIIISPLAQINSVAEKISKGEVDKRVNIIANDEIGELANSFNSMANSLEQVENHRREFISNVSHEIRSPITSIKGFIGGILDGVIPKEKQNYYLSITYEEIQRLTRLVNDLLDLSTIESGQLKLQMAELNINELIRLTIIKFETKIKEKRLKVDVCFDEDNVYIASDKDRIIQILTNLIDNAIKYVNEDGYIRVSSKVKGKKVLISIYNTGSLIAPEDLKHIWDRFYKADKSRTSKISTGLGLPIVRNLLTQLGEDIKVESGENEGVTFTFSLTRV